MFLKVAMALRQLLRDLSSLQDYDGPDDVTMAFYNTCGGLTVAGRCGQWLGGASIMGYP